MGHRGGDGDGAGILIGVFIIATAFECHLGLLGFRDEIIPNAINLNLCLRTRMRVSQTLQEAPISSFSYIFLFFRSYRSQKYRSADNTAVTREQRLLASSAEHRGINTANSSFARPPIIFNLYSAKVMKASEIANFGCLNIQKVTKRCFITYGKTLSLRGALCVNFLWLQRILSVKLHLDRFILYGGTRRR